MTDAREYMISDGRKAALDNENAIANAKAILTAAGFRILGPDEVDQVTVEKAVEPLVQATRKYTRESLFIEEHRELIRAAIRNLKGGSNA